MKRFFAWLCALVTAGCLSACALLPTSDSSTGSPTVCDEYATFTVGYDYGLYEEGTATPLLNGCLPFFDLEEYDLAPLLAGDQITVFFTGELLIRETYPSTAVIQGGEITDVEKFGAPITLLEYRQAGWYLPERSKYVSVELPQYVVSQDGSFKPLTETVGATLYAMEKKTWIDEGELCFSAYALYDYYPLPTVEAKEVLPWIENLGEVQKVKTEIIVGCNPEPPRVVLETEELAEIEIFKEYLNGLTLQEVPKAQWQVDGGRAVILTVYTATESYTLTEGSGYIVIDGTGYKPSEYIPSWNEEN